MVIGFTINILWGLWERGKVKVQIVYKSKNLICRMLIV